MSKKSKVSSKGKKSVSKKQVLKKTVKKAVKKPSPKKTSTKPTAKKTVAKPVVKKVAAKKTVKPTVKSSSKTKKAPAKKLASPKKVAKKIAPKKTKTVKPVKKAVKKVSPKKVATKKAIKVAKPVVKTPVKKVAVKTTSKPVTVVSAKPAKKVVAVAKSLKTVSTPATVQKNVAPPVPAKVVKEPAGKFEIEFVIRASAEMLYEFISTPSGLSEWFCDDVNIRNEIYSFMWEGQEQKAKVVKEIPESLIRFQWLEKMDGSYFEFRIQRDELTNDISLMITDFASDKGEEESSRLLWHSQIDKLLHVLGAYF